MKQNLPKTKVNEVFEILPLIIFVHHPGAWYANTQYALSHCFNLVIDQRHRPMNNKYHFATLSCYLGSKFKQNCSPIKNVRLRTLA